MDIRSDVRYEDESGQNYHLWAVSGADSSRLVVLLASVLKPVDDPRMRGKFAETLVERPNVSVHIAGRRTGADAVPVRRPVERAPRPCLHGIFWGSRLGLGRLAAQGRYWQLLRRLQPDVVVVHAPELLPLTLLWQRLGRQRRFVYDIRENYALNVLTQGVYQGVVRRGLAAGLRWVEARAARRAAAVILAETSYADELPFLRELPVGRVAVLENKYQPAPGERLPDAPGPLPATHEPLRLLYSGTISELNGVREAVHLAEALNKSRPGGAVLTVIGFCQQPALLAVLEQWARASPVLRLVGGARPVLHAAIVAEISRSHLGLALYRPHPSTARCRPTKLFEYLAHGLPVLIPPNPGWEALVLKHDAGLVLAPANPAAAAAALLTELSARTLRAQPAFYRHGLPADVRWAAEGKKLWHLLDTLI